MSNSNAQLYVLGGLGIASIVMAGLIILFYPGDGSTQIASLAPIIVLIVTAIVNLQKTAEAKQAVSIVAAKVVAAAEVGDANKEELKAVTLDSKVVSEQNAQALDTIHNMLNSEKALMQTELRNQRAEIGSLKSALDRVLVRLDQTRDENKLQATTIELQKAALDAPVTGGPVTVIGSPVTIQPPE